MATNITIELRQLDSKAVSANGEYEIILANEIQIEEGDVIQLREAFIDTLDESNIIIPNDIKLLITTGLIYRDWYVTDPTADLKTYYPQFSGVPLPPVKQIDYNCGRFIPYLKSVDTTSFQTIVGFEFAVDYDEVTLPTFTTNYKYIGQDNNTYYFNGSFVLTDEPIVLYTDNFTPVIAKTGSFECLNVFLPTGVTQVGPKISPVPVTTTDYKPYELLTEIKVPAGSYNPTELSIFISEKLVSMTNTRDDSVSSSVYNSNFLWTAEDFLPNFPVPGTNYVETQQVIPAEGTYFIPQVDYPTPFALKFNEGATTIIGASQMALEFNQTNNKFEFTFAHLPMYDSTNGTNICVRYMNGDLGITSAPDGGGIYFTGLSAINESDGTPFDFWEGVLGFNLDNLLVKPTSIDLDQYTLSGRIHRITTFVDGVNTVTGYAGLDSLVVKGKDTWFNAPIIPPDNQDGLCSTITNTLSIRAETDITQLLTKFSHYIVSTDLNFANNNYIASENNYRTFNGIVSKYYSFDSYTFGDSVSAIQYQHAGATQQLKSIKVRILKSNKNPDPNLLADNTIILELIKAPPSPTPKTKST
jgi:hypothetical protein